MKKLLKIQGLVSGGRRHTITKKVVLPDFKDKTVTLGQVVLNVSVAEQEREWLDENYAKIVSPHYQNGDLDMIFNAHLQDMRPRQTRAEKDRQKILLILDWAKTEYNPDMFLQFSAVLKEQWENIRALTPEQQIQIVDKTMSIAYQHSSNVLQNLNDVFDRGERKSIGG